MLSGFFFFFFSSCYHEVGMPAQTCCYFPVRCYSSSNLETKSLLKRCSMFLFGVIFETFFVVSQSLLFDHISKHDWGLTWITHSLKFIIFLRLADFFPLGDWLRKAKFLNIKIAFLSSQNNLYWGSLGFWKML